MKFLDNLLDGREEQSYALLRIVTGFLFIWHGTQKLLNFPVEFPYPLSPLMYSAGAIEMVGGVLVMIGLFTRPSSLYLQWHHGCGLLDGSWYEQCFPDLNKGELAALFCFAFCILRCAAQGSGVWISDKPKGLSS